MSFLDDLDPKARELLVRLPYRVGYWISQSDQAGGDAADALEMQALNSIIDGFTRDVFGSESVQYIMMETLERKSEWGKWQGRLGRVPAECSKALQILEKTVDPKELSAFKQRLIDIGEAVAVAFRENDEESVHQGLGFYVAQMASVLKQALGLSPLDPGLSANISKAEREALDALQKALN